MSKILDQIGSRDTKTVSIEERRVDTSDYHGRSFRGFFHINCDCGKFQHRGSIRLFIPDEAEAEGRVGIGTLPIPTPDGVLIWGP